MHRLLESPALKRLARPVYAPPRAALQYVRALRINRRYEVHYGEARRTFSRVACLPPLVDSLDSVGIRIFEREGDDNQGLLLPSGWGSMVERCATAAAEAFEQTEACLFLPPLERSTLPSATRDVPAVRRQEIISLQLRNPLSVEPVNDLAQVIVPQVEERIYGTHVLVDKVYIYRSLVSTQAEQVSWLWHYDNHPSQILKVMIYLTDVDSGRAPFEYVRNAETGHPYQLPPLPRFGSARISPAQVEGHLGEGYEIAQVTGPAGTTMLFDNNVLHRATLARTAYRDVLVLQLRPATFAATSPVDPRWTGSFGHVDFNIDPHDYEPRLKSRMFSA